MKPSRIKYIRERNKRLSLAFKHRSDESKKQILEKYNVDSFFELRKELHRITHDKDSTETQILEAFYSNEHQPLKDDHPVVIIKRKYNISWIQLKNMFKDIK